MNHAKSDPGKLNLPEGVEIIRAKPEDIEVCTSLIGTLFAMETEFAFDPVPVKKALGMLLEARDATILVARLEGRTVGMVSGQLVISTACGAPSVWVEDVVVLETQRGKGIGKMLIKGIEEWAASRSGARCQLLVDNKNPNALGFYSRLGYRPSRMIPYRKML